MRSFFVFSASVAFLCLSTGPWSSETAGLGSNVLSTLLGVAIKKPLPENSMSTPQLIEYHGYPVEEHKVTTEDGYILTMFRIPHGKNNTNVTKEPVIVQHGLLCSSNDWLLVDNSSILPYLLAEDGHDVWLGNCRGNNYSMAHVRLSPSDTAFWNFSFHEMGVYDVPAVINYVLNTTGEEELSWVGHSMGTTMFFIGMIRNPELQPKVKNMIALSPVAYINHMKTALRTMALAPTPAMLALFDLVSGGRLMPEVVNDWLNEYGGTVCSGDIPSVLCNNVLFLVSGYDFQQTTNRTASMVTSHTPSDTAIRTLEHYLQFVRTGVFQEFGENGALYNLSANAVPTLAMYGDNDYLSVPEDANRTASELGNAEMVRVNFSRFAHLDFTYAKDVRFLVYDKCVQRLST